MVDEVEAVVVELGTVSAQTALAWLLAQGDDIAPIPGINWAARVEERRPDRVQSS
jgi:aryl-alcohol dehydrogenase-like predicted oxidoreductase